MTGALVLRRRTTPPSISHLSREMLSLPLPWMGGALGEAIFRTSLHH